MGHGAGSDILMGLLIVLAMGCAPEPVTQTVLRFGDTFSLDVPEGAMIHIVAHRDGERQHEAGHDLGTFAYEPDTKLTMNATDNDGSRRFTVFAELLDSAGERISWARIRSGFVQGEVRELRIDFASECPDPSDQAMQPSDYDPAFVCGSHDSCSEQPSGGRGLCSSACYNPEPYSAVLGDIKSEPVPCPERDNLAVERLEVGWFNTCALSDSEAFCWGYFGNEARTAFWPRPSRIMNPEGRTTLRPEDHIQDLRASGYIACAVTTEGEVRCGGSNGPGEPRFFAGVSIPEHEPCCTVVAPGLPPVAALEGHNFYMCVATQADGTVLCSGQEPGVDIHETFTTWTADGQAARGFQSLYGGPHSIGGFDEDGSFRWLQATFEIDTTAPMPSRDEVVDIASAFRSLCMITDDGTLSCWGEDAFEETIEEQPRVYEGSWKRIAVAEYFDTEDVDPLRDPHRCAVAMDGSLWCWGNHEDGRLGGGLSSPRTFEQRFQVGGANDWIDVAAARRHTCGVREGGHVYCWGRNEGFELGVPGHTGGIVRVPIPGW